MLEKETILQKKGRPIYLPPSLGRIKPYSSLASSIPLSWSEALPFLRQLGWREFSYHLLFHFPELPFETAKVIF
jgi:deoxyribodipyrimidine photolyase